MHIDRPVFACLTLALLVSAPRSGEAQCPAPPPLLTASENSYAPTAAVPQAVTETGGPRVITATRLENEESILVNNFQYDTQSAVLGWQSRFRWIVTPGNDLYVVYTHNWLDDPRLNRFTTLDERAASKITYTYRF